MSRKFYILIFILLCLSGCGSKTVANPTNTLVFIEESEDVQVVNNGQYVNSGSDVIFYLETKRGVSVIDCDYDGKYDLSVKDNQTVLTVYNVLYPTRINLFVTAKSYEINYMGNGGLTIFDNSDKITKKYSITNHLRPNVSIGTDLFTREGYTLTSWNTSLDGSGTRVGLGSRTSITSSSMTLYAQWSKWSPAEDFVYEEANSQITITGYNGNQDDVIIPAKINNKNVTKINKNAFVNCTFDNLVLPVSLNTVEASSFVNCNFTKLTMFDNLSDFSDASFVDCNNFSTLYINAIEAPYGYIYRKESCYADKIDLLILSGNQPKMVFYGGCSMWYNLDAVQADQLFGSKYKIINLGLNGTVNSAVQLQIMGHYLSKGDILFHTPELSSRTQLMQSLHMTNEDSTLWCGLENNYDLFALVDIRSVSGVFDSFCTYLSRKDGRTDYNQFFSDDYRTPYIDSYGSIPFYRTQTKDVITDTVSLLPVLSGDSLDTLGEYYKWLQSMGVQIYVSYAAINSDELPYDQLEGLSETQNIFNEFLLKYIGQTSISDIHSFIYHHDDFYDTNYHLLSEPARKNTSIWMQDLMTQMSENRLWTETTNTTLNEEIK